MATPEQIESLFGGMAEMEATCALPVEDAFEAFAATNAA
jgi:hypothetical protein